MIRAIVLRRLAIASAVRRTPGASSVPLLMLACLIAVAPTAGASVVLQRSIEEVAFDSPLIVRGTVKSVESRWDRERRRIHTYAEIRVIEELKGQPSRTIWVRQPGGIVGDVGQRVEGAAAFEPGEDVVVFLQPRAEEAVFVLSGMAAGKVLLTKSAGGQLRATRRLTGLAFYDLRSTSARPAEPAVAAATEEDLGAADAFLARIRRAVRSQRAGVQ